MSFLKIKDIAVKISKNTYPPLQKICDQLSKGNPPLEDKSSIFSTLLFAGWLKLVPTLRCYKLPIKITNYNHEFTPSLCVLLSVEFNKRFIISLK